MTVLVAVASRHGATREIAEAIGRVLADGGVPAEVRAAGAVATVTPYRAVVLGSAVYAGRWLEPARRLAEAHAADLAARPVWLFSSGPLGDPPVPAGEPVDVGALMLITNARGHRVFAGRLDPAALAAPRTGVTVALRAPVGDFRDWPDVEGWARTIAGTLAGAPVG